MAKQVVVTTYEWCDIDLIDNDKTIEAVYTETFTIGRFTRNLALCEQHKDQPVHLSELHDLIQKYGTKPDAELATGPLRPAARQKATDNGVLEFCPVPTCERHERGYASKTGVRDHVRVAHGTTLSVLLGKKSTAKAYPCNEPGCKEVALSPQGLGAHRRTKHNVEGTSPTALRNRAAAG